MDYNFCKVNWEKFENWKKIPFNWKASQQIGEKFRKMEKFYKIGENL